MVRTRSNCNNKSGRRVGEKEKEKEKEKEGF
jgi:hypothetical protein